MVNDADKKERCQRAWDKIKTILEEENVALSVSHIGILPDGRVNPILAVTTLPDKKTDGS